MRNSFLRVSFKNVVVIKNVLVNIYFGIWYSMNRGVVVKRRYFEIEFVTEVGKEPNGVICLVSGQRLTNVFIVRFSFLNNIPDAT